MFGYENIKNLLIAEVGIKKDINSSKFKVINCHYVVCRYHSSGNEYEDYVYDIFNNSKYYTYDYSSNNSYCIRYIPLIDVVDDYNMIKTGYISRKNLFELQHELNNDKIKLNKKKDKEKKEPKEEKKIGNHKEKYKELTSKEFDVEPTICRKKEIDNLITILASSKKSPILVGESGVGKTTIVDEFAYLIKKGEVPRFLKYKKIIEASASSLVSGSKYVGVLEQRFNELLRYVKNSDAILFIDEIHTIFGAGASTKDDNDLAELLKEAINRDNIKVIGTTTIEEYNKYFSVDALKRRFELIKVEEPTNEMLKIISRKVFEDYSIQNDIQLNKIEKDLNYIVDLLIELTNEKHRNYNDKIYNPDLIVTLIDKSFASAKISDRYNLIIDDIIYAVESSSRIYEPPKEKCISKLNDLKVIQPKEKKLNNIIKFNK